MQRAGAIGVTVMLLLAACGGPALGSMEDLNGQLEALQVPDSMVQIEQLYEPECPVTCPSLVRWYDVSGPVESVEGELISRMRAAGLSVREPTTTVRLFTGRSEEHIFFVVLDQPMLDRNTNAPAEADVEISVSVLPEP